MAPPRGPKAASATALKAAQQLPDLEKVDAEFRARAALGQFTPDEIEEWKRLRGYADMTSDVIKEAAKTALAPIATATQPIRSGVGLLFEGIKRIDNVGRNAATAALSDKVDFTPLEALADRAGSSEEFKKARQETEIVPGYSVQDAIRSVADTAIVPVQAPLRNLQATFTNNEIMDLKQRGFLQNPIEEQEYRRIRGNSGAADVVPDFLSEFASSPLTYIGGGVGKAGVTIERQLARALAADGVGITSDVARAASQLLREFGASPQLGEKLHDLYLAAGGKNIKNLWNVLGSEGELAGRAGFRIAPPLMKDSALAIEPGAVLNKVLGKAGVTVPEQPLARGIEAGARAISKAQGLDLARPARIGVESARARAFHEAQNEARLINNEAQNSLVPAIKPLGMDTSEKRIAAMTSGPLPEGWRPPSPQGELFQQPAVQLTKEQQFAQEVSKFANANGLDLKLGEDPLLTIPREAMRVGQQEARISFQQFLSKEFPNGAPPEIMERFNRTFKIENATIYQKLISAWKEIKLPGRAGFHIKNFFSDVNKFLANGGNPVNYLRAMMVRNGRGADLVTDTGAIIPKAQLEELIKAEGFAHNLGGPRLEFYRNPIKDAQRALLKGVENKGDFSWHGIGEVAKDIASPLRRPGMKVAELWDEINKTAMFIDRLKKGDGPAVAGQLVRSTMFDPMLPPATEFGAKLAKIGDHIPFSKFFVNSARAIPRLAAQRPAVLNAPVALQDASQLNSQGYAQPGSRAERGPMMTLNNAMMDPYRSAVGALSGGALEMGSGWNGEMQLGGNLTEDVATPLNLLAGENRLKQIFNIAAPYVQPLIEGMTGLNPGFDKNTPSVPATFDKPFTAGMPGAPESLQADPNQFAWASQGLAPMVLSDFTMMLMREAARAAGYEGAPAGIGGNLQQPQAYRNAPGQWAGWFGFPVEPTSPATEVKNATGTQEFQQAERAQEGAKSRLKSRKRNIRNR